jgi:hypothetical protein
MRDEVTLLVKAFFVFRLCLEMLFGGFASSVEEWSQSLWNRIWLV